MNADEHFLGRYFEKRPAEKIQLIKYLSLADNKSTFLGKFVPRWLIVAEWYIIAFPVLNNIFGAVHMKRTPINQAESFLITISQMYGKIGEIRTLIFVLTTCNFIEGVTILADAQKQFGESGQSSSYERTLPQCMIQPCNNVVNIIISPCLHAVICHEHITGREDCPHCYTNITSCFNITYS